jgi:spermidine synthase
MNRVETIVKDHFDNFVYEYFTIKDTFFRFDRTEIITGDIVKFYENNVELSFDLIDFDTSEKLMEHIISSKKIIENQFSLNENIVIKLNTILLSDVRISF